VIAVVKYSDGDVAETASYLQLSLGLVQAAVAYYGAFVDEIDEWIERNYRRTKADIGRIVTALQGKLEQHPGDTDLANGETWL
jgi:hypothetical protein